MNKPTISFASDLSESMEKYIYQLDHTNTDHLSPRDQKIIGNWPLVLTVIHLFPLCGEQRDEAFSIGMQALTEAVDHFNPARGTTFSTYACRCIMDGIERGDFWQDRHPASLPYKARRNAARVAREQQRFLDENGYEATMEEVAQQLDLDVLQVCALTALSQPCLSLDQPVSTAEDDGQEETLADIVADDADTADEADRLEEMRCEAERVLTAASPRDREIVRRVVINGQPVQFVARDFGLSPRRIDQIIHVICPHWAD